MKTASDLLEQLAALRLLDAEQLALARGFPAVDAQSLTRDLIRRGLLTPFQGTKLMQGQGCELLLGSYLLLDKLGEGGMGAVFKARNRKLGKTVALKVIRKERLGGPQTAERFLREIQAAARLEHPHIVQALDADDVGGTLLLAMELVEGIDLARLVKQRGPLPVPLCCACVRQAALGLQHALERGLVHRDIKPSNLLLSGHASRTPTLKILDFGLATLSEEGGDAQAQLTHSGMIVGTPDFMSPEQIMDARQVDVRADLYSLGCTLYYLLAGRPPFPDGNLMQKFDRHRFHEPVSLESLRSDVPADVVAIVKRLMAKRPEDRFQTPAALAQALTEARTEAVTPLLAMPVAPFQIESGEALITPTPLQNRSPAPRRGRRLLLAIVPGLVVVALVLWLVWPKPERREQDRPEVLLPSERVFLPLRQRMEERGQDTEELRRDLLAFRRTHAASPQANEAIRFLSRLPSPLDRLKASDIPERERREGQPSELVAILGEQAGRANQSMLSIAISRDGKQIASSGSLRPLVYVWDAELRVAQVIPSKYLVNSLAFASNGRLLAGGSRNGELFLWDMTANPPTCVVHPASDQQLLKVTVSPDGRMLAAGGLEGQVYRWAIEEGVARKLPTLPGIGGTGHALAFSPDGKRLARTGAGKTVRLWKLDADPPAEQWASEPQTARILALAWSRSALLASGNEGGMIHFWQAPSAGVPVPVGESQKVPAGISDLRFAPNEQTLAVSGDRGYLRLWFVKREGLAEGTLLEGHSSHVTGLVFSPDGNQLYTASFDYTVRRWQNLDEKKPVQRTVLDGHLSGVVRLAFSSDGKHLVSASQDQTIRLWDLSKPGLHTILNPGSGFHWAAFSPDNQLLATPTPAGGVHLRLIDGPDNQPREIESLRDRIHCAAFSPDGQLLLLGGDHSLTLWNPRTRQGLRSLTGLGQPVEDVTFSPDGLQAAAGSGAYLWRDGKMTYEQGRVLFADNQVGVWDVATGRRVKFHAFAPAAGQPLSLNFRSQGKQLIGRQWPEAVVWRWKLDEDTSPETLLPRDRVGALKHVEASMDGRVLVTAEAGGELRFWDPETGRKAREINLKQSVGSIALAPDSRHLAVGLESGAIYLLRREKPEER